MRFSDHIIKKLRIPIIIFFPLVTLLFVFGLFRLQIEGDIYDLIPKDMPSRVHTDEIESIFGSNSLVMVVLESDNILEAKSLQRVQDLTRAFERRQEFERVTSLFTLKQIRNEMGAMIVDPAISLPYPRSEEEQASLGKKLLNNPFIKGKIISNDLTKTAILLTVDQKQEENDILQEIESILENIPGEEKVYMGGVPVVNALIIRDILHDAVYLLPLGLIFMTLMLYFAFRELRGVILPFLPVLMAIIISFGLMPMLDWRISIVTILMPVILIAVGNDYSIHLIAKYHELRDQHPGWSNKQLAFAAFRYHTRPILITGITTIFGILGLMAHIIVHARQLGILTAVGVAWAILMSLLFVPSILSFLPVKEKRIVYKKGKERQPLIDRILHFVSDYLVRNPKKIILFSFILTLLLGSGIVMLKIDGNVENFFREKHSVKVSSAIINKHFGGSQTVSVLFEGDILDPVLLERMGKYEETLLQNADVGDVFSIVTAIREISRGLHEPGDALYDKIPPNREAVAQYLELYFMNGDPDDFEQLLDFEYRHAQMIIRINKADGFIIRNVVRDIERLTQDDPTVTMLGGHALIISDMNLSIVNGQIKSLIFAFITVAILLMIAFKSISAGLFASLPLVLAELILFGIMGYFSVRLDSATAILSSIMIGVGIDYTTHFLWRYRTELQLGHKEEEAVRITLLGSGKGIVFNAWSVIVGFTALIFSAFRPIQYFGFLVIISISVCLIASLVLVPAMCLVWKPAFLKKGV